ncbi:hypothetical protein MASR1M8_26680 [Thermomonas brevis]
MKPASANPAGLRRRSLTLALLSVPAVVVVRPASIQVSAIPAQSAAPQVQTGQAVPAHVPIPLRPIAIPAPAGYGAAPMLLDSGRALPIATASAGGRAAPAPALRGANVQVAFVGAPAIAAHRPASAPARAGRLQPLAAHGQAAGTAEVQRWSASGGLFAPAFAQHAAPIEAATPQPRKATRAFDPAVAAQAQPAQVAPARPRAQRAFAQAASPARFGGEAATRRFAVAADAWQPAQAPQPRALAGTQATRWAAPQERPQAARLAGGTVWVDPVGLFAAAQAAMLAGTQAASATGVQRFGSAATTTVAASLAADAPVAGGNPQVDSLVAHASDPALQLRPYEYLPSPPAEAEPARPPAEQRLLDLNNSGEYARLGREGLALMKKEKLDDKLRFIIANALAWSGRLNAAERVYRDLLDTDQAANARVALANIQRWQGKDYLAVPMYKEVLASDPGNTQALEGLALTQDGERPRLRLSSTGTTDSYDVRTQSVAANYRWSTHGGARVSEFELGGMAARIPAVSSGEVQMTLRHRAHDLPMDPAVEVSFGKQLYGSASVQPTRLPVRLHAGKVNWGQISLNPRGMDKALHANNMGLTANLSGRAGRASIAADSYRVSDGNSVQTASVRYNPPVNLFTPRLRPVLGAEYRKARFNTPDYWAPAQGYGVAYAGVEGEWSGDRWSAAASVQRGRRVHGEAGPAWSASLSGAYKIDKDWSVGAGVWAIQNRRDQNRYEASSATVFVERRW